MRIDPFELFCAYHLGLDRSGARRFRNLHQLARDLGVGVDELDDALRAAGLDADSLFRRAFDLASAQADIQVSPPGVDLLGLARMHWDALQQAEERERDWESELAADARENARIFGASDDSE